MGGILQGIINPATAFPPAAAVDRLASVGSGTGQTGNNVFLANNNAGQWTTQSDLIIIGHNAVSAGSQAIPVNDANLQGLIVIGSQAAPGLTTSPSIGSVQGPSTIIGYKALNSSANSNSNTLLGSNTARDYVGVISQQLGGNVIIGESAFTNITNSNLGSGDGLQRAVLIGASVCSPNLLQTKSFADSVIIGFNAVSRVVQTAATGGVGVERNVIIGSKTAVNLGNQDSSVGSNDNVIIGFSSDAPGNSRGNVFIGSLVIGSGAASTSNVAIGSTVTGSNMTTGTDGNVVIGAEAANNVGNNRCVLLGRGAGARTGALIDAANDQFLLETVDGVPGGTRRTLLYGKFGAAATGGIIVGYSTPGTDRDIPGFNIFKMLNGTVSGAVPVGGGFFYCLAGRLHWIDTGNVDWVLTGTAAGQLGPSSLAGFANNAAANVGTLTNAPALGNPTKWVPVDDNGVIRNVPMW